MNKQMIVLYIAAVVVALVLLLGLMPVSLTLDYDDDFSFNLKVFGVKVAPKRETKTKSKNEKKEGTLKKRIKRDGIAETVKKGAAFIKNSLSCVRKFLPHIKVRDLRIEIVVAGEDAAFTAIEYGAVCAAFYPFLRYLYSVLNIKAKKVDVISSFENGESKIAFHAKFSSAAVWLFPTLYGIYKEYRKLMEEQTNERK